MQPLQQLEGGVIPSQGWVFAAWALGEDKVGVLECGRGETTLKSEDIIRTIIIDTRPLELLRRLLKVLVHFIDGAV